MTGNRENFSAIVSEYSRPLYFYIRRLVVSHEDAQDILQDTLVKAFRNLWQLRDPSALRPWLYRIATNESNRFLSKRVQPEEITEHLAARLSAGEWVDYTRDAEIKLQKALLTLSQQQREVFCLKYYEDMDYEHISKVLGSRPETLKVAYHYAKEKIKKYLDEN